MKKRIVSLLLALVMVLSLVPMSVFAADNHDGQVHVIVENTTYPEAEGAPWEGTLVEEWIDLNEDSTMMSCVVKALEMNGCEQTGAENNYISSIEGLGEFDGGPMSGWMGTLNDCSPTTALGPSPWRTERWDPATRSGSCIPAMATAPTWAAAETITSRR